MLYTKISKTRRVISSKWRIQNILIFKIGQNISATIGYLLNEDGFSKNIMSAIAFEMSLIERKDYSASETRQKRTLHSKDTERTVSNIFTKQQEV